MPILNQTISSTQRRSSAKLNTAFLHTVWIALTLFSHLFQACHAVSPPFKFHSDSPKTEKTATSHSEPHSKFSNPTTSRTEFHFQRFGNEEGLAYNEVNSIYQDNRGLIWIGTWDGLCSYDGYDFTCLNQNLFDEGTMPNTEVRAITSDESGQLLVGFRSGVYHFTQSKHFVPFYDGMRFPVRDMVRMGNYLVVMAAQNFKQFNDLKRIDLQNLEAGEENVEQVKVSKEEIGGVNCIQANKDILWIGGERGVKEYDPVQGEWCSRHPQISRFLDGKPIRAICRDKEGGTYFGSRLEVYYQSPGADHVEVLPLPDTYPSGNNRIVCMLADEFQNLWVGTHKGLFRWAQKEESWTQLVHDPLDPYSISGNQITCLMEDRSGVLWVGTRNNGLNKLNLAPKPFKNYPSSFFEKGEFIKVYAFEAHTDSTIWIGTTHGLYLFDRSKGEILENYKIPEEDMTLYNPGFLVEQWGEAGTIMSIHQQESGKLLIGSRWLGLFEFDPATTQFTSVTTKYPCVSSWSSVRKIHENEKGELWLISNYVYVIDPEEGTCIAMDGKPPREEFSMLGNYSWNLYQASECDYWIGSKLGWVHWDVCKRKTRYAFEKLEISPEYSLRDALAVFCIEPSDEGLWMGTYGNGLYQMDTATMMIRHYSVDEGLSNNHVYGIQKDGSGRLWMSTNRGISRFNPEAETFDNFGYSDDLLIREFESNSYYTCKDGEIFFGGKNGFVRFYPADFQEKSYPATPAITSFKVFGKELETDSLITDKRHLRLTSSQNFFEIGFSSLDFTNPANNKYQYKLDAYDPDWITLQGEHRTKYTNLPPGDYTFMLKAANSDGKFNSPTLELRIEIVPQLYQRTWFITLVAFLGLALVGGLIYQRLRLVREKDRRRVNLATYELEQESLRARINDHFTFNSLNSIQSFIAKNDKARAMGYVAKFGRLIRIMLNSSEHHFHLLQEEVEALELYLELEQLRSGKAFTYSIDIAPELNPYELDVPAMLIQPFVENAVWHGLAPLEEGGLLTITFESEDGELVIEIKDNGVGREQARINKEKSSYVHTSRGMQLVQGRMDLLNVSFGKGHRFQIRDLGKEDGGGEENGDVSGTMVKVWIPLEE